jgi:hypothetical protein
MQIQELSQNEILEVSGGAEQTQTVTVTGKKMDEWDKWVYDVCMFFGGTDC